jgi:hypothetical protein
MPADLITIELVNPLDRIYTNEPVPLHLLIRCAAHVPVAELRHIGCLKPQLAELDIDLFERDLKIHAGEVYRCAVSARFHAIGTHPEPLFYVQVGRDRDSQRVRVPTPPLQVVPSLLNEVSIQAESICTYDHGTKVDVTVTHRGATTFDDFRLMVGPAKAIRAGVSEQRRPTFAPADTIKFTTVIAATELELTFDALVGKQRVGPVVKPRPVPPVRDSATTAPFRFLEPRKLTQADVQIQTLDEASERILPSSGIHFVYGGGVKYRVEIKPAHPHVEEVQLRGVSGSVEVTKIPADRGTWAFQMVVLTTSVFTTPVVLHYDVTTPEGPQQGELNLAVRPQSGKLWLVALTAGGALTLKGLAAVLPAILNPGDIWPTFGEAILKIHNLRDLIQFMSIPIIRVLLWGADKVAWLIQEG